MGLFVRACLEELVVVDEEDAVGALEEEANLSVHGDGSDGGGEVKFEGELRLDILVGVRHE